MSKSKFYCPKCNRKTLVQAYNSRTNYNSGWECTNQPPKMWRRLVEALTQDPVDTDALNDDYTYSDCSYEVRWGDNTEVERAKLQEKVKAYLKKTPPCDCVIFKENGERAEITDYTTVLDKLIRPGSLILHHLIEKHNTIQRRGFQVLHSTDEVDVVRLNDANGIGVWLYWKCTWDEGRSKSEINWSDLHHSAAAYLNHGADENEKPLTAVFRRSERYALWSKEKPKYGHFNDVPFHGNLGKRKKAEIIEWVKQLEQKLKSYEVESGEARRAWESWGKQLRVALVDVTDRISISNYNGKYKVCKISVDTRVTQEQALAIAAILAPKPAAE